MPWAVLPVRGDEVSDESEKPGGKPCRTQICEEIREQATRCRKGKSCLEGEAHCRVVDSVADKVFFVEGEGGRSCSYCLSFGDASYCNCPLRQELYRKYRV